MSKRKTTPSRQAQLRQRLAKKQANNPVSTIQTANEWIEKGECRKAVEVLESQRRKQPRNAQVLWTLITAYHDLNDMAAYALTCRRLLEVTPRDGQVALALAGAYLRNALPASALLAFRHFLKNWPNDPRSIEARKTLQELEPNVAEMLEKSPFAPAERLELASLHERVLDALSVGEYREVITCAEQLLRQCPTFVPARNNLSEAYFHTGRRSEALAASRQVLEQEPENIYALGNLARHLFLLGRNEEAEAMRQALLRAPAHKVEHWTKQAETLTIFGDDEGVLQRLELAEQSGLLNEKPPDAPVLLHFAAVAIARQGDAARAKILWKRALAMSRIEMIEDNLEDLARPVGQRNGPWGLGLKYWIPESIVEQFAQRLLQSKDARSARLAAFVRENPELEHLVSPLLDRGDAVGREFAFQVALAYDTPPLHESLREFCLGQKGTDELRLQVAMKLCELGILETGPCRLWIDGKWRMEQLMSYTIINEPLPSGHSERVQDLATRAFRLLRAGEFQAAEKLYHECIAIGGEKPDLLNNLAATYFARDRFEEGQALTQRVHATWPEYFFGIVTMANLAIDDGQLDEAEALLEPLRDRRSLHFTEFAALCGSYCRLLRSRGEFEGVQTWLRLWRSVSPDDPQLRQFEQSLDRAQSLLSTVLSRLSGFTTP